MLVVLILPITVLADKAEPYMNFNVGLLSEPVSLSSLDHSWHEGGFKSGELQSGSVWAEAGIRKGNWWLSGIYRYQQHYEFHTDTADFYQALENTQQLEAGRTYRIDLKSRRFEAHGLRAAYQFNVNDDFSMRLGGGVFYAGKLQSGTLTGTATALSDREYDYHANVNYLYDEDLLFGRPDINEPKGYGYAVDVYMDWQLSDSVRLNVDVKDVLGQIHWKQAPRTQATVTSDVESIGEDGFVDVNPHLSGKEDYQSRFKQGLLPYGDIKLRFGMSPKQGKALTITSRFIGKNTYAGVGGEATLKGNKFDVVYYPQLNVAMLAIKRKKWGVEVGADHIRPDKVRALWLGLSFNK